MFARLGAKLVLGIAGFAALFFGVGFLGFAIATALLPRFGAAGSYAITGAIFAGPALLWALLVSVTPRREPPAAQRDFMTSIFRALARETPWAAVASAGLVGVVNLFLNRHKNKK
jgi:hypothetical protein